MPKTEWKLKKNEYIFTDDKILPFYTDKISIVN